MENSNPTFDYLQWIRPYMRVNLAMWPWPDEYSTTFFKIIETIYKIVFMTMISLNGLGIALNIFVGSAGLVENMDPAMTLWAHIIALYINLYFQLNKKTLRFMDSEMHKRLKFSVSDGNYEITMRPYYRTAHMLGFGFVISSLIGVQCYTFLAIYYLVKGEKFIPIPVWYPVDIKQSPFYEIIFVNQICSQFIMCSSHTSCDLYFVACMYLTYGELCLLNFRLKNICKTALFKAGADAETVQKFESCFNKFGNKSKDDKLEKITDQSYEHTTVEESVLSKYQNKYEIELERLIIDCADHHEDILQFYRLANAFLAPVLLIKIGFTIIFLCLAIYVTTASTDGTSSKLQTFSYLGLDVIQLMILGFCGMMASSESLRVSETIYECPWYLNLKQFKTIMVLMPQRAQKALFFTVGKFTELSFASCTQVLKFSFSLYTCLRSMNK